MANGLLSFAGLGQDREVPAPFQGVGSNNGIG